MQLKHNLSLIVIWDPSIYVYFNYKVNLLIGREKIFATVCTLCKLTNDSLANENVSLKFYFSDSGNLKFE